MESTKNEAWRNWKSIVVKLKHDQVPTLNQRLKLYGYETMTELTKDFIVGKFPQVTEDRQIQTYDANVESNGLKTLVASQAFDPSFYKDTNLDDMLNYLLNIRRLEEHNCRALVSYFRRYRDIFFGPEPTQIMQLTPNKRMWVLQAMRQFGNYYLYKTNNPECKELIEKIINRFALNNGADMHHRIYIVDDNFVAEKIKKLLKVEGDLGLIIKAGLYSGLREDELVYAYSMEICQNLGGCNCKKLHVVNKANGMTVILMNWFRSHKKVYFTIMPTSLWEEFRNLNSFNMGDIAIAHRICKKEADIRFMELRKLHYNAMCRVMEMNEADVLAGRAKSVAARHYVMYELDKMTQQYADAWKKF